MLVFPLFWAKLYIDLPCSCQSLCIKTSPMTYWFSNETYNWHIIMTNGCHVLVNFYALNHLPWCIGLNNETYSWHINMTKGCIVTLHLALIDSVRFSLLTDWVVVGTWGMIQQRSHSTLFCRKPLWAVLPQAGMVTLWCCPSSIFSADHGITHPPRCLEGWF